MQQNFIMQYRNFIIGLILLFSVVLYYNNCISQTDSAQDIPSQKPEISSEIQTLTADTSAVSFTDSINAEMVFVKGGTFTMGCTAEQSDCWENEKITHSVTLNNFYIGKYEITVKQFGRFISESGYKTNADKNGWSFIQNGEDWLKKDSANWECGVTGARRDSGESDHPVIHISWNDAKTFCIWLSQKTGMKYRLPTEAEWEYAARGGDKAASEPAYMYSGTDKPGNAGWFIDNSGNNTHAVGGKPPNILGLYDMSGNVWEWCNDWFENYKSPPQTNPKGPASGKEKALRGGSWLSFYWSMRVSNRSKYNHESPCSANGFRIARDAQ